MRSESMEQGPGRRRGAIITGVVLAAMALGIYLVFIFKFAARA